METTTLIILMAAALVILAIVVGVLVLRLFHKNDELKASNHSFIWVYKWWGVIPVFITTYIPFFLASNYVPDMEPEKRNRFLMIEWGLVAVLLAVLIPLGII